MKRLSVPVAERRYGKRGKKWWARALYDGTGKKSMVKEDRDDEHVVMSK
jgi:hypothetical protein